MMKILVSQWKTIHPTLSHLSLLSYIALSQPLPMHRLLFMKIKEKQSQAGIGDRMQIIAVQFDSFTETLFNWYLKDKFVID